MEDSFKRGICQRVAEIRLNLCGPRGKSAFAKQLGLTPSTYDYYENNRAAPIDVLVAISDLAGVDLYWLATGKQPSGARIPTAHPVIQRVAGMLTERPNAAAALGAVLDLVSKSMEFPRKTPPTGDEPASGSEVPSTGETWIPILGRSAAGVPHFWAEGEDAGVTTLQELIERHSQRVASEVRPAQAEATQSDPKEPVQIITLTTAEPGGVVEFIAGGRIKSRWADAFAVRIDGESMSPDIAHGDLVVLSPSVPAEEGRPAVVQLKEQIGVTCKLFRRSADEVHLIPINEAMLPQTYRSETVVWALRVLTKIRPN